MLSTAEHKLRSRLLALGYLIASTDGVYAGDEKTSWQELDFIHDLLVLAEETKMEVEAMREETQELMNRLRDIRIAVENIYIPPNVLEMRDQFAVAAMAAIYAQGGATIHVAREAYAMADAMIEERRK